MHVCGHSTQEAGEKRCSGSEDSFSKKKICLKWSRAVTLFSFDFVRDARPRLAEFTKRRSHSRKKICPPSCLRHLGSLCWVTNSTLGFLGSRLVLKVYFHVTPYFLNTRQSSREKTLTVNADLKPRGSGFTDSDVLPHVLRSDHWATFPKNPRLTQVTEGSPCACSWGRLSPWSLQDPSIQVGWVSQALQIQVNLSDF